MKIISLIKIFSLASIDYRLNHIFSKGFLARRFLFLGWVGVSLALLGTGVSKSHGQYLHIAAEGCSDKSGLFAYLVVKGELKYISLVRCSSNSVQTLFTKTLPVDDVVLPPICVSNGVVVVGVDGKIVKYAFDGTELFSTSVLKTNEISMLSGRWDSGTVYLTGMHYEESARFDRTPRYRLLWIDVLGSAPIYKGEVNIGLPMKAFRLGDDIVVCGNSNTERITAPKGVPR